MLKRYNSVSYDSKRTGYIKRTEYIVVIFIVKFHIKLCSVRCLPETAHLTALSVYLTVMVSFKLEACEGIYLLPCLWVPMVTMFLLLLERMNSARCTEYDCPFLHDHRSRSVLLTMFGAKCYISVRHLIAVCIYRLVMISIDLSETTQISENFFIKFFFQLNFVSNYITQLYFVCNHLIF